MTTRRMYGYGVLVLGMIFISLWWTTGEVSVRTYEYEYLRTDPPAFHLTPVKQFVRAISGNEFSADRGDESYRKVFEMRKIVVPFRTAGVVCFSAWAILKFGGPGGLLAMTIFILSPPAFSQLVRLDSWMDSVVFCFAALMLLELACRADSRAKNFALTFFAGVFSALALDAKLTAALTLIPLVILNLHAFRIRGVLICLAGILAGGLAAQPQWALNPAAAFEHVRHWQYVNSVQTPWPVWYPAATVFSSIPISVVALAGAGCAAFGEFKPVRDAVWMIAAIVGFFTIYRTIPPDGFRHFYFVLPFISVLASVGFFRANLLYRIYAVLALGMELVFRSFPEI